MADAPIKDEDLGKSAKSDKEILQQARERLKHCIDEENENRIKQKDDLLFCTLEQWPSDIRSARENDPNGARPCLTIDQINQYIVQVENDERQNRPAVKVRPVDDKSDIETAEIMQGVIRQIEDQSVAQIPYITAGGSAVRVGEGYFRIVTEYENEMSFNQVLRIRRVPDMFCCYLGPHMLPDGSDTEFGFIFEDLPLEVFRRKYPKAKYESVEFDDLDVYKTDWTTEKKIRVAEYFYCDFESQEIVFLEDGSTALRKVYDSFKGEKPAIVEQRLTQIRKMKWCKLTGIEILEKRDWLGKYVPIVKVTGKESWVDGKRITWGLVRPAKDSLRMYNYWASTITEKIALAPKSPFVGAKGQFENLEERWEKANTRNYSYLEYNPISIDGLSVPPPQRQAPAPIEVAMIQQLQVIREDVQSSLGMFKAALGKEQPNQSGRAILALTRESDTGTYHFQDNLALSIQHCGRILVDLVPKYYDTHRIMKILGEDGKVSSVEINPEQPQAMQEVPDMMGKIKKIYNLGVGQYDVTVTVGPSYNTKRMEAATLFTDLANTSKDPVSAAVVRYLAVKNSDFSGAEQAAEMLEKLLPPGVVKKEGQPKIPPEVVAQLQQLQAVVQALGKENQELKAGVQENLKKIEASRQEKMAEMDIKDKASTRELNAQEKQAQHDASLEAFKAQEKARTERLALIANLEIKKAEAVAKGGGEDGKPIDTSAIDTAIAELKALPMEMSLPQMTVMSGNQGITKEEFLTALQALIQAQRAPKEVRVIRNNGLPVAAQILSS